MVRLLVLFSQAVRAWWQELLFLLLLNVVWLAAQFTIVLGPPATAALYAIARQIVDRELVGPADVWQAVRVHFSAAWIWGAAQILVYGVLSYNLAYYAGRGGLGFLTLRYAWTLMLVAWFAINLYYWPLYFAQTDRRFMTTLSNAARMALLNPGFTLLYAVLTLLFITGSVLTAFFLGAVLGTWLALWGTLVVRELLR